MTQKEIEQAMLHCNTVKTANVLAQDFEAAAHARDVWDKLRKCKEAGLLSGQPSVPPALEEQYKNLKMPPEEPVGDINYDDLVAYTEKLPKRWPKWTWNKELTELSSGESRLLEVEMLSRMLKDMSEHLGEPGYVMFKPRHQPKKFNVEVFEDGLDENNKD